MSLIRLLPDELQIEVFSFLSTKEKLNLSLVSHEYHKKAFHPIIWKNLKIHHRESTRFEPKLYKFLQRFSQTKFLNIHCPKLNSIEQLKNLPLTNTVTKLKIQHNILDHGKIFEVFPKLEEIDLQLGDFKDALPFLDRKIKLYSNWYLYDTLLHQYDSEFLEKYLNVEEDLSKQKQGVILQAAKRGFNMNFLEMDQLLLQLLSNGFLFLLQQIIPYGYKFERIMKNLKMEEIVIKFLKKGSPYLELHSLQKLGYKFKGSEVFDQCILELLKSTSDKEASSILSFEYPFLRIFESEQMDEISRSYLSNQRFEMFHRIVSKGYKIHRIIEYIDELIYQELRKGETLAYLKLEKHGYTVSRILPKSKELLVLLTDQKNKTALQFLINKGIDLKSFKDSKELMMILMDHLSSGYSSILSLFINHGFPFELIDQHEDLDGICIDMVQNHLNSFLDLIRFGYSFDRISNSQKLDLVMIELFRVGNQKNILKIMSLGYNIQRLFDQEKFEEIVFKSVKEGNMQDLVKIGYPIEKMMEVSNNLCKILN